MPSRGTSTRSTASTTRERRRRLKTLGPTVWTISMTIWGKDPCCHIAIFGQPLVVQDPVKAILKNVQKFQFHLQQRPNRYALKNKLRDYLGIFPKWRTPPPPPPLLGTPYSKKKLSFILHFRPLGTFLVFTKKLKFCHFCYIFFWE